VDGLSARDLRLLRDAFDPSIEAGKAEFVAQPVLDEIARLIPCDQLSLQIMNAAERTASWQTTTVTALDEDPELKALFWRGFWDSVCSHPQRTGDNHIIWSGYRPPPGPHGGKVMLEYLGLRGWSDEVVVPLPSHDNDDHRLLLFRSSGPAFSERDIDVLTLVRAHVAELHTNHLKKRTAAVRLTPRQAEILRLVAAGSTNRQIARTLAISEGTARTHLANIYTRLGATNRTQALASAGLFA
jgi:DNA-binding CsgD family transcriptional regulator